MVSIIRELEHAFRLKDEFNLGLTLIRVRL